MDALRAKLIEMEEELALAFNKADLDSLMGFFDKEIVGFSSTIHERYNGLIELRRTFEYYLNEPGKMEYFISSPIVQIHDCSAVISFYWTVAFIYGGARHEVSGRGTHVLAKRDAGEWKIIHEHFSREHHDR